MNPPTNIKISIVGFLLTASLLPLKGQQTSSPRPERSDAIRIAITPRLYPVSLGYTRFCGRWKYKERADIFLRGHLRFLLPVSLNGRHRLEAGLAYEWSYGQRQEPGVYRFEYREQFFGVDVQYGFSVLPWLEPFVNLTMGLGSYYQSSTGQKIRRIQFERIPMKTRTKPTRTHSFCLLTILLCLASRTTGQNNANVVHAGLSYQGELTSPTLGYTRYLRRWSLGVEGGVFTQPERIEAYFIRSRLRYDLNIVPTDRHRLEAGILYDQTRGIEGERYGYVRSLKRHTIGAELFYGFAVTDWLEPCLSLALGGYWGLIRERNYHSYFPDVYSDSGPAMLLQTGLRFHF